MTSPTPKQLTVLTQLSRHTSPITSRDVDQAMNAADVKEHARYNNRAAFLMRLVDAGYLMVELTEDALELVEDSRVD